MYYISKGNRSYLACDNGKRRLKCRYISWKYSQFKADLLHLISIDIDVKKLLPDHEQIESEIDILQQEKSSLTGQLQKIESEVENLSNTIASTPDKRVRNLLEGKLTGRLDEKERRGKLTEETNSKITDLKKVNGNVIKRIENIRELMAYMKKAKSNELVDVRFRLREALRNIIDEIKLFPSGFRDKGHVDEMITDKAKRNIYYEGINNKKWQFYEVHMKGCKSFKPGSCPDGIY